MLKVVAYANCDHAYIVWQADAPVADCLGFALIRRPVGKQESVVETFVGPGDGPKVANGTSRPSTVWPIQKFMWADYLAEAGNSIQYRVVPMCGQDFDHMTAKNELASGWSEPVRLDSVGDPQVEALFNRGVVSTQWVARQLVKNKGKSLKSLVDPDLGKTNDVRDFLGGALKKRLLGLLANQCQAGGHIYASLFELSDPEVIPAFQRFGQKAHIILSDGTHKEETVPKKGKKAGKGSKPKKKSSSGPYDENAFGRSELQKAHVELHNRMVSGQHFCHHKFIVFMDIHQSTKATAVWTGSTNLTYGGVCTQSNNGLMIRDSDIATRFLNQWRELVKDTNGYPQSLLTFDKESKTKKLKDGQITAWFAPNPKSTGNPKPASINPNYGDHADLRYAREILNSAQQGILFLMLNPGAEGTLLNDILALLKNPKADEKLYIHGVANQDPTTAGGRESLIFVHRNKKEKARHGDEAIILPAAINVSKSLDDKDKKAAAALRKWVSMVDKYWKEEPTGLGVVRVHSKMIVVDPFGAKPVVMTGSHNLGSKASAQNDDNFVILEGFPLIAQQYAVNVITVYNQYRWAFQQQEAAKDGQPLNEFHGLQAPWKSQGSYFHDDKLKELRFWM
jgi:phosphatidylserine/phosphatidylglycerophosphate/cardiolipin synthase-like enzyme